MHSCSQHVYGDQVCRKVRPVAVSVVSPHHHHHSPTHRSSQPTPISLILCRSIQAKYPLIEGSEKGGCCLWIREGISVSRHHCCLITSKSKWGDDDKICFQTLASQPMSELWGKMQCLALKAIPSRTEIKSNVFSFNRGNSNQEENKR